MFHHADQMVFGKHFFFFSHLHSHSTQPSKLHGLFQHADQEFKLSTTESHENTSGGGGGPLEQQLEMNRPVTM